MNHNARRATLTAGRVAQCVTRLASILLIAGGCRNKQPAPAQRTLASASIAGSATAPDADAPDSVPAEWAVNGPVWRFVVEWNAALDRHDAEALRAMYADRVSFYGQRRSKAEVIRAKQTAFEAEPDFHQQVPGFIDIRLGVGDYYVARFWKLSGKSDHLSGSNAKLVIGRGDGGPALILEEADEDASEKQNSACEVTAAEVVNALPQVERSMAHANARADASNGELRVGGIGPQDSNAPDGFSASIGLNSDERFETVISYEVDREGRLTVYIASEGPVVVPPAALRKVTRVCRR
jgi:hypothetical protein